MTRPCLVKIKNTALKLMINAVHIYQYFFGFINLYFYFLLFLFLFPPPPILREPEDTEQEIKIIWPYLISFTSVYLLLTNFPQVTQVYPSFIYEHILSVLPYTPIYSLHPLLFPVILLYSPAVPVQFMPLQCQCMLLHDFA